MLLKSGIEVYSSKIIKSGNVYEIYRYEKPIFKGFKSKGGRHHQDETSEEEKVINRDRVLSKNRRDIRRLVNSNFNQWGQFSKFLTLTFRDDVRELEKANYEFKKFKQRLEYEIGFKMKYLCVPELTKKGRVHYHVAIFNMPYVKHKDLLRIWGNGGLNIKEMKDVDNVGAYICKYLTKDMADSFKGKKCYTTSRGLLKPKEITNEKEVAKCSDHLTTSGKYLLKYETSFENDYTGKVEYMQLVDNSYHEVYHEREKYERMEVAHE